MGDPATASGESTWVPCDTEDSHCAKSDAEVATLMAVAAEVLPYVCVAVCPQDC